MKVVKRLDNLLMAIALFCLEYVKESIGFDGHSYNRERVNGVVRNSDVWYELFGIKPGDALYLAPEKRAYIW